MGITIELIMTAISILAACGAVGFTVAKRLNRNPWVGAAIAAAFPLAGVGILLILGKKSEKQ